MELTQTVATLQDEIKLLKGEIKFILKEIRSAVLTNDNPFVADVNPPTFRSVDRPGADDPTGEPDAPPEAPKPPPEPLPTAGPATPPTPPTAAPGLPPTSPPTLGPVIISAGGPSLPPTAGWGPPPAAGPPPGPTAGSEAPPAPALAEPRAPPQKEPTPLRPAEQEEPAEPPEEQDAPPRPPAQRWNLLTIAGLTAWAEDALATLGPRRFQLVLELGSFADLLSPEVRDVLCGLAQFAPAQDKEDRPININECLVVLRQLEAILQGEKVSRLPRRRRTRRSRVR